MAFSLVILPQLLIDGGDDVVGMGVVRAFRQGLLGVFQGRLDLPLAVLLGGDLNVVISGSALGLIGFDPLVATASDQR